MEGSGFEARFERYKLILFILLFVGLSIIGLSGIGVIGELSFLNPRDDVPEEFGTVISWLLLLVSAYVIVGFVRLLLKCDYAYRIDDFGIHFGRTGESIPWAAISSTRRWSPKVPTGTIIPMRQNFLVFEVDPEFARKPTFMDRIGVGMYSQLSLNTYQITAVGTDKSLQEIIEGFNKFAPEHARIASAD